MIKWKITEVNVFIMESVRQLGLKNQSKHYNCNAFLISVTKGQPLDQTQLKFLAKLGSGRFLVALITQI